MRLGAAVAIAAAVPLLRLRVVCGEPMSEACVWGKAYLPLAIGLSLILLSPLIYLSIHGVEWLLAHRRRE